MAALDFPSTPETGQVYTADGKSWMYNGFGWDVVGSTGTGDPLLLNAELPITYNGLTSTVGFDESSLILDGGNA